MKAKTKRIEYRVTEEFFAELEKYRKKFSMTLTQAITVLLLKALRNLDQKIEQPVSLIQKSEPVIQSTTKVETNTASNGNYQRFQEYNKRKIDPDMNEDDWLELVAEIKNDTLLNQFQREKLLRPIGR